MKVHQIVYGAMAGDAIDSATAALLEGLVGFFPSRKRKLLDKALTKLRALQEMVYAEAERTLDSGELERRMRQELAGSSATSSPESRESIPDR